MTILPAQTRRPIRVAGSRLSVAAVSFRAVGPGHSDRHGRPNIVLILSDDQGYHDAGFQGALDIPTPHTDATARHGGRCTSGYVTDSVCSPFKPA